jgi:hypothetical protein
MTRTDWRIAAVVVAIWALGVALSAFASTVADFAGSPRQGHAFHMVSVGLLLGGALLAVSFAFIAVVIALKRTTGLRGGARRGAGTPYTVAGRLVPSRFNDGR